MAQRGRKKTVKKTSRRSRIRTRLSSIRKNPKAQFIGRSSRNIVVGSAILAGTSRMVNQYTSRLGIYAQPANLILAGATGKYILKSGQSDLISAGIKIAGSRFMTTQLVPRLEGMAPRIATGRTVTRGNDYGT